MCGIAGVLDWASPPDTAVVERMTCALAHRGPNASGVVTHPPIALGHRRLAVIDLSEDANQPMADESQSFWIVYNGEIYNFREIRGELETAGARFRTSSDTEVLLEAYKRWEVGCLDRLNGMFALALWDDVRQWLFLARDRAGGARSIPGAQLRARAGFADCRRAQAAAVGSLGLFGLGLIADLMQQINRR